MNDCNAASRAFREVGDALDASQASPRAGYYWAARAEMPCRRPAAVQPLLRARRAQYRDLLRPARPPHAGPGNPPQPARPRRRGQFARLPNVARAERTGPDRRARPRGRAASSSGADRHARPSRPRWSPSPPGSSLPPPSISSATSASRAPGSRPPRAIPRRAGHRAKAGASIRRWRLPTRYRNPPSAPKRSARPARSG